MIKRVKCFLIAIIDFIKHGSFVQHLFIETEEPAIIIATDTSFRVSDNFQHEPCETVYPNATLIRGKCKYCGYESLSWKDNNKNIPILETGENNYD